MCFFGVKEFLCSIVCVVSVKSFGVGWGFLTGLDLFVNCLTSAVSHLPLPLFLKTPVLLAPKC